MDTGATAPGIEALLQHDGFLRALARSLLFDDHEVDDVVQEAGLRAEGLADGLQNLNDDLSAHFDRHRTVGHTVRSRLRLPPNWRAPAVG